MLVIQTQKNMGELSIIMTVHDHWPVSLLYNQNLTTYTWYTSQYVQPCRTMYTHCKLCLTSTIELYLTYK